MDSLNLAILYVTWFDRDIDCIMVQTEVKKYVPYSSSYHHHPIAIGV